MHIRSYISALAITLGLSAASGASALETANGLSVNGLSVNGLSVNGLSVNGLSVNGLSVNGRDDTGAASSGMRSGAVILQDGSLIVLH